jgi:dTDP-glucose 4,6-dehydratase
MSKVEDVLVIGHSSFTGRSFYKMIDADPRYRAWGKSWRDPDYDLWRALQPKYIVNFAAANIVQPSWDNAAEYVNVNVTRIAEFSKWLRTLPLTKYVHVSTPEVYGATEQEIYEDHPHNPSTPYAVTRSAAEKLLMLEYTAYGLPVCFTRAANVYGPGQQRHRLIPAVFNAIIHGEPFLLEGGGLTSRQWLYIDDAVHATELVMRHGQPGQAYNIPGDLNSVYQTVELCACVAGEGRWVRDNVEDVPARTNQDPVYNLVGDKIARLGYNRADRVRLQDGVRRVWESMQPEELRAVS